MPATAAKKARKPKRISRTTKPKDLSVNEWQLALREQFGRENSMKIRDLGQAPVFSEFAVTYPETEWSFVESSVAPTSAPVPITRSTRSARASTLKRRCISFAVVTPRPCERAIVLSMPRSSFVTARDEPSCFRPAPTARRRCECSVSETYGRRQRHSSVAGPAG